MKAFEFYFVDMEVLVDELEVNDQAVATTAFRHKEAFADILAVFRWRVNALDSPRGQVV